MGSVVAIGVLAAAIAADVALMVLARSRRGSPGAFWVGALGGLAAFWCAVYAAAVPAQSQAAVSALAYVTYPVIGFIPPALLMAALSFHRRETVPWQIAAAVHIPALAQAVASLTNPLHHRFLVAVRATGDFRTIEQTVGPLFTAVLVATYLTVAAAVLVVVATFWTCPSYQRPLVPVMLVALLIPPGVDIAWYAGLKPLGVDWVPVGMSVSAVLLGYAILRLRLLDVLRTLVPAGRRATVEVMADGVVVLDRTGEVMDANPAACAMAGRALRDVLGLQALTAFPDWPHSLFTTTRGFTVVAVPGREGAPLHLEVRSQPLNITRGLAAGRVLVLRDVTARVTAETALRDSERRYRELVEHASDVVFSAEPSGRIVALNAAGRELLGIADEDVDRGATLAGEGGPMPHALLDRLRGEGRIAEDVDARGAHGQPVVLEVRARVVSVDGTDRIEGIARDVTERRSWEARLSWQASHDPLTALPNRLVLRERLDTALRDSRQTSATVGFILIDLDHFRDVNDTLGHLAGDEVLRVTGERLARAADRAATVGRLAGDEFAVVLPDTTTEAARHTAHALLAAIEEPHLIGDRSFALAASLGVAFSAGGAVEADELMRRADAAMYDARSGRRGVAVWSTRHARRVLNRLGVRAELQRAIEENALELHYQPQVRISDGRLMAVEALVRWRHPERGMLLPAEFVPLAEEYGGIEQLTRWVVDWALGDAAAWRTAGIELPVAINVSPLLLDSGRELMEAVETAVGRHSVDRSLLKIEITETAAIKEADRGGRLLHRLAESGVTVSIDDFGIGQSSLALLRDLPVAEIKLDRTFVRGLGHGDGDITIVRSVIGLGHELGMSVVAEGVEDGPTWDILGLVGCDIGQGFHICPPLTSFGLLGWMRSRESVQG